LPHPAVEYLSDDQERDLIDQMTEEMEEAAENLEFERAAEPIRKSPDEIKMGTAIADEKSDDEGSDRKHYGSPDQLSSEVADPVVEYLSDDQKRDLIEQMTEEMEEAAENLEFERAAELRDSIEELKEQLGEDEG